MASNYTGLGVQLMTTGEKAGLWGGYTNTNWEIMEQIAGGYLSKAITSTPTTLAVADGTSGDTNEVAHRVLEFTGSIGEATIVTIPLDVQTFYIIKNSSSGAYTVQFKYVTGSGGTVTWSATDKGTKLLYATANDVTNPDIIDVGFGTGDVTLTGTQTLTNKTLTSPAIGTSILDTGGNELMKITVTGSAENEFTMAAGGSGAGPTLSSTGSSDTNIDMNLVPAGTGNVNLSADTVQVGDNNADATLTTQGTGDLILNTNNGTNAGNITLADGANGNIEFTNNGTGVVKFNDAAYNPEADLTFDATQDWDVQASPVAKVTLTANVVFDVPSNPTTGQFISILCIQDGGGSNTIGWNAIFEFAAETAPTATTTGGQADLFSFRYNGAKWLSVGTTIDLTVA
jgi:hypothetical protein